MRQSLIFLSGWLLVMGAGAQVEERPAQGFIRLDRAISSLIIDLRYASGDNIVGEPFYESATPWLHRDAVRALKKVVARLRDQGYRLVIWDAYRPPQAQWRLWHAYPDPEFVADPRKGSRHSRGTTVDVTLADREGKLLEMPTDFDVFTKRADHELDDLEPEIRERVEILRNAMFAHGFRGVPAEWWHYDLADWPDYPIVGD